MWWCCGEKKMEAGEGIGKCGGDAMRGSVESCNYGIKGENNGVCIVVLLIK
jgi:hypothetical protein